MACTIPIITSPGYLRLNYEHTSQGIKHSTRVHLIFGVDPSDYPLLLAEADSWSHAWKAVVTSHFTATDWSLLRADGSLVYTAGLSAPQVGTHAGASGALDYASRTVTFTGRGIPGTPGNCTGEAESRLFCGDAFEFIPRQRYIVVGADAGCDGYAAFLRGSAVLWADFFGHEAGVRGLYPVQFNAYQQKRNGT